MKDLLQIINEKLKIRKSKSIKINHIPKTISDLKYIVGEKIKNEDYDLSDIDVSNVLVFDYLFRDINRYEKNKIKSLDVTGWDVSNAKSFKGMFFNCFELEEINGIEEWNVASVNDMRSMFYNCKKLICDISDWKINDNCNIFNIVTGAEHVRIPNLFNFV